MFSELLRKVGFVFILRKTIISDFWTQSALTNTALHEPQLEHNRNGEPRGPDVQVWRQSGCTMSDTRAGYERVNSTQGDTWSGPGDAETWRRPVSCRSFQPIQLGKEQNPEEVDDPRETPRERRKPGTLHEPPIRT